MILPRISGVFSIVVDDTSKCRSVSDNMEKAAGSDQAVDEAQRALIIPRNLVHPRVSYNTNEFATDTPSQVFG